MAARKAPAKQAPENQAAAPAPLKTGSKAAGKPSAKAPAAAEASSPAQGKRAKTMKAAKSAKSEKSGEKNGEKSAKKVKAKIVRDSFTMPAHDHAKLAELKKKCLEAGVQVKKNELLRAGLAALGLMPVKRLLTELRALEPVKTGRPAKA